MCFYERLKDVRIKRGYTSKEMAKALGVAPSSYSQYENGKREPDVIKIKAISDILNVSADYLLFGGSFKTNSINQKCNKCIELLKKLDEFDIAEITGEIKQMLKAPKYNKSIYNIHTGIVAAEQKSMPPAINRKPRTTCTINKKPHSSAEIAAWGADGTEGTFKTLPEEIT